MDDGALGQLAEDVRDAYGGAGVARVPADLDALVMHRAHVAASRPVVLARGLLSGWPASTRWGSLEAVAEAMGPQRCSVGVTPDGRADALVERPGGVGWYFALPEVRSMTVGDFAQLLRASREDGRLGVPYVSHQNDSLTQQFGALAPDVGPEVEALGRRLFGRGPDAVNLWIGDARSVSSMHRDPYENLYAVVHGEKTFTLLPPTERPRLRHVRCQSATWRLREGDLGWELIPDPATEEVSKRAPWVAVDPSHPDVEKFPEFVRHGGMDPLTVTVHAGEVLYLPALWYHQVSQGGYTGEPDFTVAVNYWFDMDFDLRWAQHRFLEALCEGAERRAEAEAQVDDRRSAVP